MKIENFPDSRYYLKILDVIPASVIHAANRKHTSNRYYKKLPLRVHLVSLLYGVFSYSKGLREVCEGLLGCEGKLFHLGLDKAPARSTFCLASCCEVWVVIGWMAVGRRGNKVHAMMDRRTIIIKYFKI